MGGFIVYISISVEYLGFLQKIVDGKNSERLTLPAGATLTDLKRCIVNKYGEEKARIFYSCNYLINNRDTNLQQTLTLHDGDVLTPILSMQGG